MIIHVYTHIHTYRCVCVCFMLVIIVACYIFTLRVHVCHIVACYMLRATCLSYVM